jgi:hypothetical protein
MKEYLPEPPAEILLNMEDIYNHWQSLREATDDLETQYKSEVEGYGDAWPGACEQLAAARENEAAAEKKFRSAYPNPIKLFFDDIPF